MKALIARTDGTREVVEVDNLLSKAQEVVGGYVDIVRVEMSHVGEMSMFVNDEGLLIGLEQNALGSALYAEVGGVSPIVGDVLITGGADYEGNTLPLSDDQERFLLAARVVAMRPEVAARYDGMMNEV